MSDTNPKHTPMTDAEFENQVRWSSAHPDTQKCVAEARRARRSEAALKARVAELEDGLRKILAAHNDEEVSDIARALLSPRDGEAEPEYCAHCNRIDVPGYHQSDCPAAGDEEAK